jgi:uncharacterized protein YbaA (DUF1428 family)
MARCVDGFALPVPKFGSRAHPDRVNVAVLKDPRTARTVTPKTEHAFDGRGMVYGSFKTMVEA